MLTKLLLFFLVAVKGYALEFESPVLLEGFLRRAQRTIIINPDGDKIEKTEGSMVLVPDAPLVITHDITLGGKLLSSSEMTYPYIEASISEEFRSLLGKRVQCQGKFYQPFDHNKIIFEVEYALDCECKKPLKTLFYEPEEIEVSGTLYERVYPGPPEYTSIEMGDFPEAKLILTLKEPINVALKEDDKFNEPQVGVRELHVLFNGIIPLQEQMNGELTLKGTLFSAHTAHHCRRVLMDVKSWKMSP